MCSDIISYETSRILRACSISRGLFYQIADDHLESDLSRDLATVD